MKRFYLGIAGFMFVLYVLYHNGLIDHLVFCRNKGNGSWVQGITAQFIHFTLLHYLCNIYFGREVLCQLEERLNFIEILISGIFIMLIVAIALITYTKDQITYCGSSGIILGQYSVLMLDKIVNEGNGSERKNIILDGIIFFIISIIVPGVSVLMHLSGIIAGVTYFFLLKLIKRYKK